LIVVASNKNGNEVEEPRGLIITFDLVDMASLEFGPFLDIGIVVRTEGRIAIYLLEIRGNVSHPEH